MTRRAYCSLWGTTLLGGLWRQGFLLFFGGWGSGDSLRSQVDPEYVPGHSRGSCARLQHYLLFLILPTKCSPGSPLSLSLLNAFQSGSRTRRWLCLLFHWISVLGPRVKLYSWNQTLIILIMTMNSKDRHFQICWIWNIFESQVTDT